MCIHGAAETSSTSREELIATWLKKTCKEAHDFLSKPDVLVTNKKDKEVMLPTVERMNAMVKEVFQRINPHSTLWLELKGDTLDIQKEAANEVLEVYRDTPLNVISVCGPLRIGKSYLMNSLLEMDSVFGVSSQIASFTRGIHLSSLLLPYSRLIPSEATEPRIAFCDMEGQDDMGLGYDI